MDRAGHEFAQRVEDLLELVARVAAEGVMVHGQLLGLLLQLVESLGQFTVRGGEFPQAHEGQAPVRPCLLPQ